MPCSKETCGTKPNLEFILVRSAKLCRISPKRKFPVTVTGTSISYAFIKILATVNEIIKSNKANVGGSTKELENQLDELVMDFYDLSEDQKNIIRNS